MQSLLPVRVLYGVAAAFIAAAPQIYARVGITPPNHWGYIHFAAGMLAIFGYMFLRIALSPVENRNLVPYGVLLKICYVATVAWHWYFGGIPAMWKYFAFADAVFAILFVWSLGQLRVAEQATPRLSR